MKYYNVHIEFRNNNSIDISAKSIKPDTDGILFDTETGWIVAPMENINYFKVDIMEDDE